MHMVTIIKLHNECNLEDKRMLPFGG
jgi:hypothetical protein